MIALQVLDGSVQVRLELPEDVVEQPPAPIDLSAVPGARLELQRHWEHGTATVDVACASVPQRRWLPGLHDAVMDGATVLAGKTSGPLRRGPVERSHAPERYVAALADERGAHQLVFARDRVLLCTLLCEGDACAAIVPTYEVSGELHDAPAPGLAGRLVGTLLKQPRTSVAVTGATLLLAVALLLARRPRPKR